MWLFYRFWLFIEYPQFNHHLPFPWLLWQLVIKNTRVDKLVVRQDQMDQWFKIISYVILIWCYFQKYFYFYFLYFFYFLWFLGEMLQLRRWKYFESIRLCARKTMKVKDWSRKCTQENCLFGASIKSYLVESVEHQFGTLYFPRKTALMSLWDLWDTLNWRGGGTWLLDSNLPTDSLTLMSYSS